MFTVYVTADTADADAQAFPDLHDALAYIDSVIRDPDVWFIELWEGNATCVYTFSAPEPTPEAEHAEHVRQLDDMAEAERAEAARGIYF